MVGVEPSRFDPGPGPFCMPFYTHVLAVSTWVLTRFSENVYMR